MALVSLVVRVSAPIASAVGNTTRSTLRWRASSRTCCSTGSAPSAPVPITSRRQRHPGGCPSRPRAEWAVRAAELPRCGHLPAVDDQIVIVSHAVGPWTVQGGLLLALGREDVVVPGDLRVRRAVQTAYRLGRPSHPRRLAPERSPATHLPQPARLGTRLEWHDSSRIRAGDPAVSGLSSLRMPMAGSSHHAAGPPRPHERSAGASRRPAKSPELSDACSPSPAQRWQTSKAREHAMRIGLPGARRAV